VLLQEAKSRPSSAITRLKKQPAATAMTVTESAGVEVRGNALGAAQEGFYCEMENKSKKIMK
jgi:hypothetical protein